MLITGQTRITGILAGPEQAGHSLSPAIHNAAFRELELDWVYLPFGVQPESLAVAIKGLVAAGVRGMNVTMPHKMAAMRIVDSVTDQARLIGALNTIEVRNGELIGHNTDGDGLARYIHKDLGVDLGGCSALVIGSGGSARASVAALASAGVARIRVLARQEIAGERLRPVAGDTPFESAALTGDVGAWVSSSDVIVHCTPVGQQMQEPIIPTDYISSGAVVVDLVYKPPVTPLIQAARERGAVAHSGLGMLLNQAALAFEIWTGTQPPMQAMSAAALMELAKPSAAQADVTILKDARGG